MEKEPVMENPAGEKRPAAGRFASGCPAMPTKPVVRVSHPAAPAHPTSAFVRAATEDDDGYDPYSDRPCDPEPRFEADPWR